TEAARQALDNLRLADLLSKDLPIRRQQAALGVIIANAGLTQTEYEVRYGVTRNYLSILYASQQLRLLDRVRTRLLDGRDKAKLLEELGAPNVDKFTTSQFTSFIYQVESRRAEGLGGRERAGAALREAMGVDAAFCLVLAEEPLPELAVEV